MKTPETCYRLTRLPHGASITRGVPPTRGEFFIDPRLDLRNHSPDGFEFGYGGSSPSQAALAILADFFRHDYPNWTQAKIAQAVRCSKSFVSWTLAPPDKAERRRVYDSAYGRARRAGHYDPASVARAAVERGFA